METSLIWNETIALLNNKEYATLFVLEVGGNEE